MNNNCLKSELHIDVTVIIFAQSGSLSRAKCFQKKTILLFNQILHCKLHRHYALFVNALVSKSSKTKLSFKIILTFHFDFKTC